MDTAEFDRFADEYDQTHEKNIAVTGEKPEFFHEYKIKVLAQLAQDRSLRPNSILDFGSGIGNSTPFLRRYFPTASLAGAEVSQRSLDVAESRFSGLSTGLLIDGQRIPAKDNSFDIVFSACVFITFRMRNTYIGCGNYAGLRGVVGYLRSSSTIR